MVSLAMFWSSLSSLLQYYSRMWTDEKHSLFLEHLEFSFVKQLHQSISLLPRCLDQDEGDRSIRQVDQINACDTSEQVCWGTDFVTMYFNYLQFLFMQSSSLNKFRPYLCLFSWLLRNMDVGKRASATDAIISPMCQMIPLLISRVHEFIDVNGSGLSVLLHQLVHRNLWRFAVKGIL